jgi:hypothetical protein
VHFAAGEASLAIVENTVLANRHREPMYRPLQFHKGSQLFIGVNNETLSGAVYLSNPDRLPVGITSRTHSAKPVGVGLRLSDCFPNV